MPFPSPPAPAAVYVPISASGEDEQVLLFTFPVSGPVGISLALFGDAFNPGSGVDFEWDWFSIEPLPGAVIPDIDLAGQGGIAVEAVKNASVGITGTGGPFEITGFVVFSPVVVS